MEGMKRRAIVNALLCGVLLFALLIYIVVTEAGQEPKYELPGIQSSQSDKIVTHTGYTVSFNSNWKIPNWVAYELAIDKVTEEELWGNNFVPDPDIYGSPSIDDYKNSGYACGQMAPTEDMKWSKQAMDESFYTSNICPQNKNLEVGDWKALEEHVRSMATRYDRIYVSCGPIVSAQPKTIGQYTYFDRITVPDAFFKVILRRKEDSWSAVGFMMPNQAGHKPLNKYAMSVDDIEMVTDIDFFVALPDSIEEIVESTCNLTDWDL